MVGCFVPKNSLHFMDCILKHGIYTRFGNPANSPVDMVVYPIIYRVSYMLGGAGFLSSTVSSFLFALFAVT